MNSLKLVPEHAKKVISAFLAQGDELGQDPMSVSAPQANAYEFQSQVRRLHCAQTWHGASVWNQVSVSSFCVVGAARTSRQTC